MIIKESKFNDIELNLKEYQMVNNSDNLHLSIGSTFLLTKKHTVFNENDNFLHFEVNNLDQYSVKNFIDIKKNPHFVFNETLSRMLEENSNISKIHLFFEGQISLAFSLGRLISRLYDIEEVIVYYYNHLSTSKYPWGINLKNNELIKLENKQ